MYGMTQKGLEPTSPVYSSILGDPVSLPHLIQIPCSVDSGGGIIDTPYLK